MDNLNSAKLKMPLLLYQQLTNANRKELYILVHFFMLITYTLHGLSIFGMNEKKSYSVNYFQIKWN